jgi:chromosome segregation protein
VGKAELALAGLKRKAESLAQETKAEEELLARREAELGTLHTLAIEKRNEALYITDEKESLVRELSSMRGKTDALRTRLTHCREALASLVSRGDSLREIIVDPATKELLLAGADGLDIKTTLSDVIEVAPEYEKPVEAALKELASGFIVLDRAGAFRALKAVRGGETGRTAFIPLTAHAETSGGTIPAGAIGRASEFVKAEPGYEGLAGALLADVLLARELEDVPEPGGFTVVSLRGEVLDPKGTVTAGQNRGLLEKKRLLREIEREIEGTKAQSGALEKEINGAEGQAAAKEEALRGAEARAHELEKESSLLNQSIQTASGEIERVRRKSAYLRLEEEELKKETARMEASLGERLRDKEALEARRSSAEQRMREMQEEISAKKEAYEEERAAFVEARMEASSIRQGLDALKKESASVAATKEDTVQRLEKAWEEAKRTTEKISGKESEAEGLTESLRELVKKAGETGEAVSGRRSELSELGEELMRIEESAKSLRGGIDALGHSISEGDVRSTELRMKLENLQTNIYTSYGIDIASYETEGPVAPEPETQEPVSQESATQEPAGGEKERIAELKAKIAELGPVSLGTIEEYEELKNRFEFLAVQREDLEKSIAELDEAIRKINSSTRSRLREAFHALNGKFQDVFREFFGGGRSELRLTDEDNILETGIDIVAQPPGKKLQNIHLLSGGEKSLTALSLLFASFLIKPTPLCVLDEADAALDESNTVKFAQMLRSLAQTTQFIVITHNRVTMEAADYIYGITMQEPGVSKAISMRFAGDEQFTGGQAA